MNMPPPPVLRAYAKHNKALLTAARAVASTTMFDDWKEIHVLTDGSAEEFSYCGVSCDGTWQKRGYWMVV